MLKNLVLGFIFLLSTQVALANEATVRIELLQTYPKLVVDSVIKTPYAGLYEVHLGDEIVYTDENLDFVIVEGKLIDINDKQDVTPERKTLQQIFPKVKVESVTKTQYGSLFEVYMGGEIVYSDENSNFIIVDGRLIEVKSKRDITTDRLDQLSRIEFSVLPLDQAIKVVKGNGSRKMAVFSDPDCPYCKQLEQESLSAITDITVYTFLFPIARLHPDAPDKSKIIWCAPDRGKAWGNWMLKGFLPQGNSSCGAPLDKIASLGQKIGVNSTPTLFFADGTRIRGAISAEDVEKALDSASKKPQK